MVCGIIQVDEDCKKLDANCKELASCSSSSVNYFLVFKPWMDWEDVDAPHIPEVPTYIFYHAVVIQNSTDSIIAVALE